MRLIKIAGIFLSGILSVPLANAQKAPVVAPLPAVDSVRASLEKQLKEKAAGIGKNLMPADTGLLKRAIQENKKELGNLLRESQMPAQMALSKIKLFSEGKAVRSTGLEVSMDYSYLNDTSGVALGTFQDLRGIYNYGINTGVTVLEMPFDFSFRGQNGVYAMQGDPFDKLLKFNFDHKKYVEKIRNKVAEKLSPDVVLAAVSNRITSIRTSYEARLKKEIESLKSDFSKEYKTALNLPEGITDLSKNDLSALKSKLLSAGGVSQYEASAGKIQEALKKGNVSTADTALLKDMANVKQRELLEKVYQKIVAAKDGFENNKLVKQLKSHLPFTPDNYKSFLTNPGNLGKLLDDHVNLNFIQRLFVDITRFDVGQNPVQGGDFDLQNLVNTGINTTFKNKKTSVGFIYGKNNNVNNWLQAGLHNSITNEYSSVTGFTFGSGTGSAIEKSISLNFFNYSGSPGTDNREGMLRAAYLGVPQRRDATITVHTGYTVGTKHKIGVDVSKSFGSFVDNISQDSALYKVNAHNEVFSGSGTSNFAAMVDYTGELLETDVRLFVKKVGMGYNNPGNSLLRRGETQVGAGLGRKWLNNKLTTRYHVDYRRQNFDPLKRYSHTTLNNKVQLGYKIRRNNRVGIIYQRSDFSSRLFAEAVTKGGNTRLQVDGAYDFKVAGKKIMNNVVLSHQQLKVPMLAGAYYTGNSVMVMYSSTTMISKSPLSIQVMVNKSDNTDYLFNTSMFTVESNYSYAITDRIRFGSGLGYYTNAGWNRQVGGRQQLSAVLLGKLNLDVEVSYRKAVHIERKELANQLFVTAGAHFNF